MMRVDVWSAAVLVAALLACGPTIDVGQNVVDGGAASDAAASEAGEGGGGDAGQVDASARPSKTKGGESCATADLPPAASTCSIPGTYTVTENLCGSTDPTCTDIQTATPYTWTAEVSVTGTTVKLTNHVDRLLQCTLSSACTCLDSGYELHFTSTGFVAVDGFACRGGTGFQRELDHGVKQ